MDSQKVVTDRNPRKKQHTFKKRKPWKYGNKGKSHLGVYRDLIPDQRATQRRLSKREARAALITKIKQQGGWREYMSNWANWQLSKLSARFEGRPVEEVHRDATVTVPRPWLELDYMLRWISQPNMTPARATENIVMRRR